MNSTMILPGLRRRGDYSSEEVKGVFHLHIEMPRTAQECPMCGA